jgi:methionyl aminopeptidase
MKIHLKNSFEIQKLRAAGLIQAKILNQLGAAIKPGITTYELSELAEKLCQKFCVKPAFKNHQGFPAAICTAINNVVVHGIPKKTEILANGDIIGVDFGVILDGFYADACQTFLVGQVKDTTQKFVKRVRESLYRGIQQAVVGNQVSDISCAIQNFVESFGYGVVRETVGHGIGRALHEPPKIPNYFTKKPSPKLQAGMVICIEPIITLGSFKILTEKDKWTVRTKDSSLSAHFEHQVLITEDGTEILTPWSLLEL